MYVCVCVSGYCLLSYGEPGPGSDDDDDDGESGGVDKGVAMAAEGEVGEGTYGARSNTTSKDESQREKM